MILLIKPPEAPNGRAYCDILAAIRVLYSTREASEPSINFFGRDAYEAIWPWTDLGAAVAGLIVDGVYRLDLRGAIMPQELEVGKQVWISLQTRSGAGDIINGSYVIAEKSSRHIAMEPS